MRDRRSLPGRVSSDVFLQYSIILALLLGVSATGLASPIGERLAWFGLAWVAVAVLADVFGGSPKALPHPVAPRALVWAGLVLAAGAAYGLRALVQSHTVFPPGYDYGFYRAAMDAYASAGPHISEAALPAWIKEQFEPGVLYLHLALHRVAGIDSYEHLRWLFPFLSAGFVVPLFCAVRERFGAVAGLASALLYAASFTQLTVYEYLYEKNVLGLALWLALLITIKRRAWLASGLLLGGIGFLHRPTFLLAVISLVPAVVTALRSPAERLRVLRLAVALPIFLPVWLLRARQYFGVALLQVQVAGDNVGKAVPEGGGTFLSFVEYQNAAAAYLPVALAGAIAFWWRRERVVSLSLLACFINVALHLVFFNRFIIMLDLVALALAGAAYLLYLSVTKPRVRATIFALVLLVVALPTVIHASQPVGRPYVWLSDEQRNGLHWARDNLPQDSTILASNLDGPYVAGETGRRTFAPGLFSDPHKGSEWRAFFTERDNASVDAFLAVYPRPLFIFHATGHGPGLGTAKFVEPRFHLEYDESGVRIWSYDPPD